MSDTSPNEFQDASGERQKGKAEGKGRRERQKGKRVKGEEGKGNPLDSILY
jgi:hypothetical protein